jgi:hypothetical protein
VWRQAVSSVVRLAVAVDPPITGGSAEASEIPRERTRVFL